MKLSISNDGYAFSLSTPESERSFTPTHKMIHFHRFFFVTSAALAAQIFRANQDTILHTNDFDHLN